MNDLLNPAGAELRLSDSERDAAAIALRYAADEGRLPADELADRVGRAMRAKTRGDLAPLFADLPGVRVKSADDQPPPSRRTGGVLVALSPFVALALFFVTGATLGYPYAWLWFLLIPVTAIIVYGGRARRAG
ncbi:MAG TPA: DUF1707 domain-containing protein [Pseudolysinimonas sp.]|jgi:hypothetical protein|nr:DUF1707 domain-containing protein [Pseudolysinimonas sp.]